MKPIGMNRRVDDLGRIVIPKEIRRSLLIREGDSLEIFTGDDCVIFKKVDTKKNISNIIDLLRSYVEDDGSISSNVALGQKIRELEAEVTKALSSAEGTTHDS
jgi:AbrB family looped-hinge helix DNA binding protein